jgi:NitT/TauT family transport system substrate-binding protein
MSNDSSPFLSSISRRAFIRRSAATAVSASGSTALLSGCRDERVAGVPLTFVTFQPLESLTFAPELFADAAGYFRDQNLRVAFESTRSSAQAVQLILANRAHLARVGQIEVALHASNRSAPVIVVGTLIRHSTIRFVSCDALPLREPRDFEGRAFGIPSERGESEITLDLCLAKGGIDPDSVTRQVVGVGPGIFSLVEEGRIAGYAVSLDMANALEQRNRNVVTFKPSDFISSGAQVYLSSLTGANEHQDGIRRFLAAIRAAVEFIIGDTKTAFNETLRIIRQKYSFDTLNDDALARVSLGEYVTAWTAEGRANVLRTLPQTWGRAYEELVAVHQAEAGKVPTQWYTNEFLPSE